MNARCSLYVSAVVGLLSLAPNPAGAQVFTPPSNPLQAQEPANKDAAAAPEEPADGGSRPEVFKQRFDYPLKLDWHPIGPVVREGKLTLSNRIPLVPSGFAGDTYSLLIAPTYGLGGGWEVSAGVSAAERIGPGGTALFYGGGIQKQFVREHGFWPALSVGGYGLVGPHDHNNEAVYLSGTKRLATAGHGKYAFYMHGGGKFERFDDDDYGSGTGVRPYVGGTLILGSRLYLRGEVSPAQPWQRATMYATRATYLIYKGIGVTGGIRSNGYETHPFVSIAF